MEAAEMNTFKPRESNCKVAGVPWHEMTIMSTSTGIPCPSQRQPLGFISK